MCWIGLTYSQLTIFKRRGGRNLGESLNSLEVSSHFARVLIGIKLLPQVCK